MTSIIPSRNLAFRFHHRVQVRYADLDPQRHVNNAAVVTYLESARMGYYQATGIWQGISPGKLGMVVAALHIDYHKPIVFGQKVDVGLGVFYLGNKSLRIRFEIKEPDFDIIFANGEIVMVAFDPQKEKSIPIPQDWRDAITKYENLEKS